MKFCKICKLQIFFMKESLRVGDFQDEFDIFPNRSDTVVKNCQNTITPDNHHRFIVLIKEDWHSFEFGFTLTAVSHRV